MSTAIKKTISLPPELAHEAEEIAREEGKTLSGVIQDALRMKKASRQKKALSQIQNYWSEKAKEKGIFTEEELSKYLEE